MRVSTWIIAVILPCILMSACGGGSGGDESDESKDTFVYEDQIAAPIALPDVYTGSTSQSVYARRTTKPQSFRILSALGVYLDFASFQYPLDILLTDSLPDEELSGPEPEVLLDEDGDIMCSEGRTSISDRISESTGLGTALFFYDNCVSGDLIFDGHYSVKINEYANPYTVSSYSMDFDHFLIFQNDEAYGFVDGKIEVSIKNGRTSIEGSLLLHDPDLGGQVFLENIALQSGSDGLAGTGRVHLSNSGYSDFQLLDQGEIRLEGASESSVSIRAIRTSWLDRSYEFVLTDEEGSFNVTIPADELLNASFGENVPPELVINELDEAIEKRVILPLSAEGTQDRNFDFIRFQWDVISAPENCDYELTTDSLFNKNFSTDCFGDYVLEARLDDGEFDAVQQTHIHVYKDLGQLEITGPMSPAALGETEVSFSYEVLNEGQGPFDIHSLGALFPVDFDSFNSSFSFVPQLPILDGHTEINLPVSMRNDRVVSHSGSLEVIGNNTPYRYVENGPMGGALSVVDYDNDGRKEILSNSVGGPAIYEINESDGLVFEWAYPYSFTEELGSYARGVQFVDYDQDEDLDLLYLVGSHLYFINGQSKTLEHSFEGHCDTGYDQLMLGNFDADAEQEAAVYCQASNVVQVVELMTREIAWEHSFEFRPYFYSGNVDGDSQEEILAVDMFYSGKIFVLDYQEREVVSSASEGYFAHLRLADIDGNGAKELVGIVRAYNPMTGEVIAEFDIGSSSGVHYSGWHNIDGDPQAELVLLADFWGECGVTEGWIDCLKFYEMEGDILIEQASYPYPERTNGIEFVAYDAGSSSESPSLYLKPSIDYVSGSITRYTGNLQEDIPYFSYPEPRFYHEADGKGFFYDYDNNVLKFVKVLGNQIRVTNFDLATTKVVSHEVRTVSGLNFNPDKFELIRTSPSSFNIFLHDSDFHSRNVAIFDYANEDVVAENAGEIFVSRLADMNQDGNVDVVFTRNYADTTISYWDFTNNQLVNDIIDLGPHWVEDFKVDPVTGDLFVVQDEFINDLVVKRYATNELGGFDAVAEGRASGYFRRVDFGDYDKNGEREVYLIAGMRDSEKIEATTFDYQLNLLRQSEAATETDELAYLETTDRGDLFFGAGFRDSGYTEPGHVVTAFSPLHTEEIWISPELDIDRGDDGELYPFIDVDGKLRLAINSGGFYITK